MSNTPQKTSTQIRKYGTWDSPINAEQLFDSSLSVSFLRICHQGLYFITNQDAAPDRFQLCLLNHEGITTTLSPTEFNLRSSVHEYGGMPYAFTNEAVYYVNSFDHIVYKQALGKQPSPLTSVSSQQLRYADFIIDERHNRLICIREDHRDSQGCPEKVKNTLVAINLDSGGEGDVIYDQSDFVSSPKLSPDGRYLCWQCWDHPNMPWDETELLLAEVNSEGNLFNVKKISRDDPAAIVQPLFHPNGDLFFISDWSNWWNLYWINKNTYQQPRPNIEHRLAHASRHILKLQAECTGPQWVLGQRNYALLNDNKILFSYSQRGVWFLGLLDIQSSYVQKLPGTYGELSDVVGSDSTAYFTATTTHSLTAIYKFSLLAEEGQQIKIIYDPLSKSRLPSSALPTTMISAGQAFEFMTSNGQTSHGFFYPPKNTLFKGPTIEQPPLIVGIHGGPTSAASTSLSLKIQYWTSRGFAIAEINHRGSSGFGRKYRQSLYQNWGVLDLDDVVAGVNFLIKKGLVDANKLAIHGGSAGGYTVMAMLTFHDIFKAGTSYYGISDLESLTQDTHKFESHYLDQLIGPYPEEKALYQQRSPIHHVKKLTTPLLLIQGLQDKVVPPDQAKKIYHEIKEQSALSAFMAFPDEGHGFRKKKNQVKALETELNFYKNVFEF